MRQFFSAVLAGAEGHLECSAPAGWVFGTAVVGRAIGKLSGIVCVVEVGLSSHNAVEQQKLMALRLVWGPWPWVWRQQTPYQTRMQIGHVVEVVESILKVVIGSIEIEMLIEVWLGVA